MIIAALKDKGVKAEQLSLLVWESDQANIVFLQDK